MRVFFHFFAQSVSKWFLISSKVVTTKKLNLHVTEYFHHIHVLSSECVCDIRTVLTMKANIGGNTVSPKALAPQQLVKRGLLICSPLAVGHNKTLGANEAFRHCVTLQVDESSCANKASQTLGCEDSAACDRGLDSICHHYSPIKKFHRVQLPSFMKRHSATRTLFRGFNNTNYLCCCRRWGLSHFCLVFV